jgi:hypothetical protein
MQTASRKRPLGKRLFGIAHHPMAALVAGVLCAMAASFFIRGGLAAHEQLAAADDPVAISDRALAHAFNRDVAEGEIRAALAARDVDLAQSFVALAADRNVTIDPGLTDAVAKAGKEQESVTSTAGRFVHGLWTGEPSDLASLAGTAFGDLFVFGDIRDAAREGTRYLSGQQYDPWILGLAGAGLAITALTYSSLGATTPERVGLSLIKGAKRTGRLNPVLAVRAAREAVKVEDAGGLVDLAENAGRVESKAGTQAALDTLAVAEEPQDVSRMARLAAANGGKTRAIIKLLGRAAILLSASALDIAFWIFWAAIAALGFCSSCKAAVERLTQRAINKRKLRGGYAIP